MNYPASSTTAEQTAEAAAQYKQEEMVIPCKSPVCKLGLLFLSLPTNRRTRQLRLPLTNQGTKTNTETFSPRFQGHDNNHLLPAFSRPFGDLLVRLQVPADCIERRTNRRDKA